MPNYVMVGTAIGGAICDTCPILLQLDSVNQRLPSGLQTKSIKNQTIIVYIYYNYIY